MTFMIQKAHALQSVEHQRAEARVLLDALVATQHQSEPYQSDNRRDLFKRVTGHSSLENAIDSTRRAIEAYDRMIGDTSAPPLVPTIRVTATGVPSVL
jgi:hypothetical protein